jgi:hypothetical protein
MTMIVKPSQFLEQDSRFKSWGKVFRASDFDADQEKGYAIKGKFVQRQESVALGDGEFLIVASETGSRANHCYVYALVMGGPTAVIIRRTGQNQVKADVWEEFLAKRSQAFGDQIIAKAQNSTLYRFGLFAAWMAKKADGVPEPISVDLSGIDDETLAAELTSRGWACERKQAGACASG